MRNPGSALRFIKAASCAGVELRTWTILTSIGILGLAGCQTTGEATLTDGYHLGLVRVRAATSPETSRRVETLGLWVDQGVGVGWRDSRRVTVSSDCQVVFLVSSPAQLEQAMALVRAEEQAGGKLCVALEAGPS